ncbi:MAG: CRISPR system precrRNA processing endoribonuclease RAMP protein Cas6 [Coleofasciculaceae cyanobacterium]
MLIRSTWTLTTNETAVLPRSYGLELVKILHEKLGLVLGSEIIPSVSFSGLSGYCSRSGDFLSFYPEEFYRLSLSGLEERAAKAIASLDLSDRLAFLGAKFNLINREDETTSYEQLYTKLVAEEPEPARQFALKFLTPTSFSQQKTHLPLPVPALMFRSWLEKWNNFAPVYLGGDELVSYLSSNIRVKRHRIQTRTFQLHRGYVTGFTGDVKLQVSYKVEPLLANVANLLINYAPFSGTGIKTRLGMGRTDMNLES